MTAPESHAPNRISRRSWLKFAGLGSGAALLPSGVAAAAASGDNSAAQGKVRGVIFMVSDGMSAGMVTMAEQLSQLTRKRPTSWPQLMSDAAASNGLMDTASANSLVTDSAAAASAWGSGQRVNNGAINTNPSGKKLPTIGGILKEKYNALIGLVTTATVTHATPAGFVASVPDRNMENEIALQYLQKVDVILGGGSQFFDAATRPDKKDLEAEFAAEGYEVVHDRKGLMAAAGGDRLLGLFSPGHLPYTIDRDQDPAVAEQVPTLAEMAAVALDRLLPSGRPFLLQIEGARIDQAAHMNDIGGVLWDQLAFDDALALVLERLAGRDDVLLVVTSDHGNSNPGLNSMGAAPGSTTAFARIPKQKISFGKLFADWKSLGGSGDAAALSQRIQDGLGFTPTDDELAALLAVLAGKDVSEWNHQHGNPPGILGQIAGNHNGVGWTGVTHTYDPTIVTAIGPQSARFRGFILNTDVFRHLSEAFSG